MKKAIFIIALLLVIGLFIAGCSKNPALNSGNQQTAPDGVNSPDATPDAYVNDQIVDDNQSVEIGSMI